MNHISESLRQVLHGNGAVLIGYADLTDKVEGELTVGVSVAVCIPIHIVKGMVAGPTWEYFATYHELNNHLNRIVTAGANFLQEKGYDAIARTTDIVVTNENQRTSLPHKTVAIQGGLGWIGKSNLLITKAFGSAVRISSLLTNAPLECNKQVMDSQCGSCNACKEACPGKAIHGHVWSAEKDRDEMFDMEACRKTAADLSCKKIGQPTTLCGKCIVVCPFTKKIC